MYMWALRGYKCTCGPSGAANVHVGPPGLQMYMWAPRGCKCSDQVRHENAIEARAHKHAERNFLVAMCPAADLQLSWAINMWHKGSKMHQQFCRLLQAG